MPDYYFHLKTSAGDGRFEQKHELPNLDAALVAAHQVARKFIRHAARRCAAEKLRGSLDVEDASRRPVARLMLADVARQIS